METNPAATVSPLEERIAELGDPDVVPDEVRERHREGRVLKAHALLRAANARERDTERSARQRDLLADLRLWVEPAGAPGMHTINGVGTRLMGEHQSGEDGCYVATLWATLVFIPILPLSSWLVAPAEEGGWYFLGRTPLVPSLRRVRGFVARAALLAAGVAAWAFYQSHTHVDVVALNGFDVPLVVSVGEQSETLFPRQHRVFPGVPAGETRFSARAVDGAEPLEEHTEPLSGWSSETVVYNVLGRAVLRIDYIRYGRGEPPEGELLPAGPVLRLPAVDYAFTEPPQQKSVREGGFVQNSVLVAIDTGADSAAVASFLLRSGRPQQALEMSRAELRLHPENAQVAWLAARYGLDPEAGRALLRDCLSRAPDSVDLHRYYQELWPPEEREPLLEEYRARLDAAPDSAREHYLLGRLLEDSKEAIAACRRSLELDPEFWYSVRSWGYHAGRLDDWATAERMYARYAAEGPDQAAEMLGSRLSIARARRAGAAALEKLLGEVEPTAPLLAASWRVRFHAESSRDAPAAFAELDQGWPSADVPLPTRFSERARLAVVAGDLEGARKAIAEGADEDDTRLLLALSDGASPEDRAAVRPLLTAEGLFWFTLEQRLLALALAEAEGWEEESARLRADMSRDGVGAVAALIHEPPTASAALTRALASTDLEVSGRAAASFALAWRLHEAGAGPGSGLERRLWGDARRLGLPGELPFTR